MHRLLSQPYPMRYAINQAKPYAFKSLQERIKCCKKCSQCKKCDHAYTLWGNYNATLLIILTWPDKTQDELTYLQTALDYYGVDPDILAFTYAFHCNGYSGHQVRPPYAKEIEQCSKYTKEAIEIIEPLAILCMSTIANNLFYKQGIDDSVKQPSFIHDIPIFTTYPPSYILNLYKNHNILYKDKHEEFFKQIKCVLDYLETTYPKLALYK